MGEISKEGACVVRENGSHKLMLQLKFWQQFRIQAPDHFSFSSSLVVHRSHLGIVYECKAIFFVIIKRQNSVQMHLKYFATR